MAAVQQAMPQQQQQGGGGNATMARMLPPGMSKEKVQEIYRVCFLGVPCYGNGDQVRLT